MASYWQTVMSTLLSDIGTISGSMYNCFLFPLCCAFFSLVPPVRRRGRVRRYALVCGGVLVSGVIVYALFSAMAGDYFSRSIYQHILLLFYVCLLTVFFCPYPTSVRVVVASEAFTLINLVLCVTALIFLPMTTLTGANVLQIALLILITVFILCFRPAAAEQIPVFYWLSMLVMAVISFVCLFYVRYAQRTAFNQGQGELMGATKILLGIFLLLSLFIYYLYHMLTKEHRKALEMEALQRRQERDVEFYERSEALCRELHGLRHELKNDITAMQALIADKNYARLDEYFNTFLGRSGDVLDEFFCDDPVVCSLIRYEQSNAHAVGVRLDVTAAIPGALALPEGDVCSLLSNLLDNAVEGCLRAGGSLVKSTLRVEKGFLFVSVSNPVRGDVLAENPSLRTTKRAAAAHGFGIPVIRRIVEKHDGCITFACSDGLFTADAMLSLEEVSA